MQPITITTVLDENHEAVIHLPELPPGPVKITVESVEDISSLEPDSHGWVRAKLRAAGLLAEEVLSEAELARIEELSEAEEEALAERFSGGRSIQELIDEDREERF